MVTFLYIFVIHSYDIVILIILIRDIADHTLDQSYLARLGHRLYAMYISDVKEV